MVTQLSPARKVLAVLLSVILVMGLSPFAKMPQSSAYAAEGDLAAAPLMLDGSDGDAAAEGSQLAVADSPVASVTKDGVTTEYATFAEAVEAAKGANVIAETAIVELLASPAESGESAYAMTERQKIQVKLGSYELASPTVPVNCELVTTLDDATGVTTYHAKPTIERFDVTFGDISFTGEELSPTIAKVESKEANPETSQKITLTQSQYQIKEGTWAVDETVTDNTALLGPNGLPLNAGTYTVTIQGLQILYAGTETKATAVVSPADIASATMAEIGDQTYTGEAITPDVSLTLGGYALTDDDYDVAYEDNTDAGLANVTVTGKGNFTGTKTGTFRIQRDDIVAAIGDLTFTSVMDAVRAVGTTLPGSTSLVGSTIVLQRDTSEDVILTQTVDGNTGTLAFGAHNITFDLNGYTLSSTGASDSPAALKAGMPVTMYVGEGVQIVITDNSNGQRGAIALGSEASPVAEGSAIYSAPASGSSTAAVVNINAGTVRSTATALTLDGAAVSLNQGAIESSSQALPAIVAKEQANLTVGPVQVSSESSEAISGASQAVVRVNSDSAVVSTDNGPSAIRMAEGAQLLMNSGFVSSETTSAIVLSTGAQCTLSAGTVQAKTDGTAVMLGGAGTTLNASGGMILSQTGSAVNVVNAASALFSGAVGVFSYGEGAPAVNMSADAGAVKITGGSFTSDDTNGKQGVEYPSGQLLRMVSPALPDYGIPANYALQYSLAAYTLACDVPYYTGAAFDESNLVFTDASGARVTDEGIIGPDHYTLTYAVDSTYANNANAKLDADGKPVNAGVYTVTATGTGAQVGDGKAGVYGALSQGDTTPTSVTGRIIIAPQSIGEAAASIDDAAYDAESLKQYQYTSEDVKPALALTYPQTDGVALVESTDFTATWPADLVALGQKDVQIAGVNEDVDPSKAYDEAYRYTSNYQGSRTISYTVVPNNADLTVTVAQPLYANGSELTPEVSVKSGNLDLSEADYDVAFYSDEECTTAATVEDVGTYYAKATGKADGNFDGAVGVGAFEVSLAVAEVGATQYKSIQDAIDAADEDATVTLLVSTSEAFTASKGVAIDLGGNTLTATGKLNYTAGSSSLVNGTVDTSVDDAIEVHGASAQLTLGQGLTVDAKSSALYVYEGGKVTVGEGALVKSTGGDNAYTAALATGAGSSIDVAGGAIQATGQNGALTLKNGASSNISAGEVSNAATDPANVVVYTEGTGVTLNMTGGTVTAGGSGAALSICGGTATISGGTVKGASGEEAVIVGTSAAQVSITGGVFTSDSTNGEAVEYPSGMALVKRADGLYALQKSVVAFDFVLDDAVYTGLAQDAVVESASAKTGSVEIGADEYEIAGYALYVPSADEPANGNASLDATTSKPLTAGVYVATISGKGDCAGSETTVLFSIGQASLSDVDVTLSADSFEYNAAAQAPSVTAVKLGDVAVDAPEYTAAIPDDAVDADTYTIVFTATDGKNFKGTKDVTFDIAKKRVTKPTAPATLEFLYDETEKVVVADAAATDPFTIANNKKTDTGTYTLTYSLKDKANYEWYDGSAASTDDVTFEWKIKKTDPSLAAAPATLALDMIDDAADGKASVLSYDGDGAVSLSVADESVATASYDATAKTVTVKPAAAGTTSVAVSLAEGTNHDAATATIDVTVANKKVAKPSLSAVSGLAYTGAEQTGVTLGSASDGYVLSGDKGTDAGDYTATVKLNDGYEWEDGTVDTLVQAWSIAKQEVAAPTAAAGLVYTGAEQPGVILPAGETRYTLSGNAATAAGDHTATATLADPANYKWNSSEEASVDVAYVIAAKLLTEAMASGLDDKTYKGFAWEPVVLTDGEALTADDYSITYEKNINVGTAEAKVEGKNNYSGTLNLTFKILPHELTTDEIDAIDALTFTGQPLQPMPTVTFNELALAYTSDFTVAGYENNTNAGTAKVKIAGTGNFTGTPEKEFVINPANLAAVSIAGIPDETYDGSEKTPRPEVTLVTGSGSGAHTYALAEGADKDFTYSYEANTEAGTAAVVKLSPGTNGNFIGEATKTFTIKKADPSLAAAPATLALDMIDDAADGKTSVLSYDGDGAVSLSVADESVATASYDATAKTVTVKPVAAGTTSVTVELTEGANHVAATATIDVTVSNKKVAKPSLSAVSGLAYTGAEQEGVVVTPAGAGDEAGYTVVDGKGTAAGDYEATVNLNAGYEWEDGTADTLVQAWSIAKQEVPAPEAQTGLKFNGAEQTGVVLPAGETRYTLSGNTATKAADYTATATLADSANYKWVDSEDAAVQVAYSIEKESLGATSLASAKLAHKAYTGSAVVPDVADVALATSGAAVAVAASEYRVVYAAKAGDANAKTDGDPALPLNAGTYEATFEASADGSFTGSVTLEFTVDPYKLTADNIAAIPAQLHGGDAGVKPTVSVSFNGAALNEGTDFDVSYADNVDASEHAKAIVSGKGNFTGEPVKEFVITMGAAKIDGVSYPTIQDAIEAVRSGSALVLDSDLTETITIPAGKDIAIDLNGHTLAASNGAGAAIDNKGALKLSDSKYPDAPGGIKVAKGGQAVAGNEPAYPDGQALVPSAGNANLYQVRPTLAVFNAAAQPAVYTGTGLAPAFEVKSKGGSVSLAEGTDFTASYAPAAGDANAKLADGKPLNAGSYVVTLTGKAAYAGTTTSCTFTVAPAVLANAGVTGVKAKTYNGKKHKQNPAVTFNGAKLAAGVDYTIAYAKNKKAGKAKMTLTGKGNFTGSLSKTFKIKKVSIKKAKVKRVTAKYYTGKKVKQSKMVVKFKGKKLKPGRDYKVKYKNNKKIGKATVIIKGKGNFKGVVKKKFKIVGRTA